MQKEEILKLLESDDKEHRLKGVSAYYELLTTPKDDDNKNKKEVNKNSSYKHTKLWRTIRRRTWNNDEADEIVIQFFEYISRRFKTGGKVLSQEELAKEKKAPVINNLEAFAFWKCKLLVIDLERKMGKQKEREVVTDIPEAAARAASQSRYFEPKTDGELSFKSEQKETEQDGELSFDDEINKQQLIEECIKSKLEKFAREVSAEGAEAIAMQLSGIKIKDIANMQNRKEATQREFIRASKEKARSYFAPCNEIGIYSNLKKD